MRIKKTILFLMIFIVITNICYSEEGNTSEETKTEEKTAFDAAWRSALLPGWGQFYNGDDFKGYLFAGSTAIVLTGTIITYFIHQKSIDDYNNASIGSDFDALANKEATFRNINNIFFLVTIGLWLYNIFDAYIFHDIDNFAQTNNINSMEKFNFKLSQNTIVLSYNIKQF